MQAGDPASRSPQRWPASSGLWPTMTRWLSFGPLWTTGRSAASTGCPQPALSPNSVPRSARWQLRGFAPCSLTRDTGGDTIRSATVALTELGPDHRTHALQVLNATIDDSTA